MLVPLPLAQAAASLIAPGLAVAGLAAVAVPITLHLLSKRRRRQRPWAAMRFLREAIEKQRRRLRFERWLLLACRCLAVALLGLALAGPLVGGALASALGVAGAAGRSLELVIDDGITSGALNPMDPAAGAGGTGGATPLEDAKRRAAALLATLGPEDRVRVWPLSGGGEPAAVTPERAGEAVAALSATDAAADFGGVLPRVAEAAKAEAAAGRSSAVAVLSPFFAGDGTLAAGRGPSAFSAGTGDGPRVRLSRPAAGRDNLQVASVRPPRAVVAAASDGGAAARLEARVTVRRAGTAAGGGGVAETRVEVVAVTPPGPGEGPLDAAGLRSRPSWASGSGVAVLPAGVDAATLRVRLEPSAPGPLPVGGGLLVASLGGGGAVVADDVAVAAVEVVEAVWVGLLGGGSAAGGNTLGPADFLAAALTGGGFETRPLRGASDARRAGPGAVDAVAVLDPLALGPAGREMLAAFAAAGGAVWVTPSAAATADDPGAGVDALTRSLGLPWRIGSTATSGAAATRRADADAAPPAALPLLAGQWEALLRPLRLERSLTLSGVDPASAWVRFEGGGVALAAGRAAGPAGEPSAGGSVLLLASALDPGWTNLPAKPVFPALVRDATLAAVAARAERTPAIAGPDAPVAGVASGEVGSEITAAAVAAADTSAVAAPRVAAFFAGLGEVDFLPDEGEATLFDPAAERASLAGGLLWAVLALLVLEAATGRLFTR